MTTAVKTIELSTLIKEFKANAEKHSREEKTLKAWLEQLPEEELRNFLTNLSEYINNDYASDEILRHLMSSESALGASERGIAADIILHEIKGYSGNTFNIFAAKPVYEETLAKVHRSICSRHKAAYPEVASVSARERHIADLVLRDAFEKLKPEDVDGAMRSTDDLANLSAKKKQAALEAIKVGGVLAAYRFVGKRALKDFAFSILEKQAGRLVSEKVVGKVLFSVAKKIPQKSFQRALGWFGIALVAKDIYELGGEATRFTVPFITQIAILRSLDRLNPKTS